MTQSIPSTPGAPQLSLVQRFSGMLFAPKATFESVVSYPRWLGMMLVCIYLTLLSQMAFTSTEAGRQMVFDQQIEFTERFTRVTPEMEAQMRARMDSPISKYAGLVAGPVFGIVVLAAISGILFGIFAMTGGTASFKQVMAIVAHAGVPKTVIDVLMFAVYYAKGSMSGVTNLGVLWPGDETAFLGRFLGSIDLLWMFYLFMLALGLAVLYRRRTQSIFLSLLGVYVVIAAAVAGVRAALGGS